MSIWYLDFIFNRKDLIAQQREYKRKKAQKKAQRMKAMDEERETEKNKWLDFNSKVRTGVVVAVDSWVCCKHMYGNLIINT